jgi:transposase
MIGENSCGRVESSSKVTKIVGHLGLIAGVFRELEVDKLIDEKLPKKGITISLTQFASLL